MGDNDVREIKEQLGGMQKELTNLNREVSSLTSTVNLLVEGKIKMSESDCKNNNDSTMAKVTMAAMEITRLAVAALTGYFAGRGGGS